MRHVLMITVPCVAAALLGSACFGDSAATTSGAAKRSRPIKSPPKGTISGRVFTTSCGGVVGDGGCAPANYRGSLAFCRTMNEIGPCPSAHVDPIGHFRISLVRGRYALVPAPGQGNVVSVTPRWVSVGIRQTKTIDIDGGRASTD